MLMLVRTRLRPGQCAQLGRRLRTSEPGNEIRAGYQPVPAVRQHAHHQSLSSMGRGRTRIATSTPSPTTSTRRLVASRCSVTPRIARHKSRQHRSDMDMQQGDRTGDPDATARLGAQRLDRLLRRLGLNQHRFAMLIKVCPTSVTAN